MKKQKIFLPTNVKHLRLRRGWSQEELAGKLGITRSKLSLVEMGKTVNPPVDDLVNFAEFFGVSVDTLLKVDLSRMNDRQLAELEAGNDAFATGTKLRVLAITVDQQNNSNVELVPEKARAGYRSGYGDPEWIAELPRYAIPGLSKHSKYRIFPISGDSMLPYPDGCYIVGEYWEDWMNLKDDSLCVLILKNGGADFVFKQVENRIKKSRKIIAKSLNLNYEPYEIPVADVLEIWRYKLHIAKEIGLLAQQPSNELVLRTLHEMKIQLNKLSERVA